MATLRRSARIGSTSASATPDAEAAKPPTSRAAPRKRKVAAVEAALQAEPESHPSTATAKRPRGRPGKAPAAEADTTPPLVPPATPSKPTKTFSVPPTTPRTPKPKHAAINRLANPDVSNAMLISPETSRIVTALPADSLGALTSSTRTTTGSILEDACAHLISVDPKMKALIDAKYCTPFSPASLAEKVDPFESLASSIISQQVSGAAARSIKNKFLDLFGISVKLEEDVESSQVEGTTVGRRPFPHPSQVAPMSIEKLRTAGLSQRKAEYIKGLAEKFVSGELSAQLLADAPYDTLVERLVAVRGLGLWSVEMFAMFGLKRMDVFSTGDLGVQRGMAAYVGRDIAKLKRAGAAAAKKNAKWKYMTDKEMTALAEPFRPYRSVFMWYMWQVEDVDVSTLG